MKYSVLSEAGANKVNRNSNNFILAIKDTKLYVSLVTLSKNIKTSEQKICKINLLKWV